MSKAVFDWDDINLVYSAHTRIRNRFSQSIGLAIIYLTSEYGELRSFFGIATSCLYHKILYMSKSDF